MKSAAREALSEKILDEPAKENLSRTDSSITSYPYAGVSDRLKAIVADAVMLGIFMFIIAKLFAGMTHVSDPTRMMAFIFVFCLYDPLFTSIFGGTIGHLMNGLRVKQEKNQKRNIPIHAALVRFAVKACLGWLSLLTVSGNDKSRAIHDFVAGSVVVFKSKLQE
jgi:uncharacterized RDD family membrane protein YckC